jgi:ABC-type lipoprotein release transport system permease subunit
MVVIMSAVLTPKLRKDYVVAIGEDIAEQLGIQPGERVKVTIEKYKPIPHRKPLY